MIAEADRREYGCQRFITDAQLAHVRNVDHLIQDAALAVVSVAVADGARELTLTIQVDGVDLGWAGEDLGLGPGQVIRAYALTDLPALDPNGTT